MKTLSEIRNENFKRSNQKINVFFVEDDPLFKGLIEQYFEKNKKYALYSFSSGDDFFKKLKEVRPDIVLMDYNTKSLENIDLNEKIIPRIKKEIPESEVLILAESEFREMAKRTKKAGAFNYIIKNKQTITRLHRYFNRIIFIIGRKRRIRMENFSIKLLGIAISLVVVVPVFATYISPELEPIILTVLFSFLIGVVIYLSKLKSFKLS